MAAKTRGAFPYLGIRFLAKIQPIELNFFMAAHKTIIYWLVMRNLSYDAYLSFSIFGPIFAGKWAWLPRAPLRIWGLQTNQKIGLLGGKFGPTAISKSRFWNFH